VNTRKTANANLQRHTSTTTSRTPATETTKQTDKSEENSTARVATKQFTPQAKRRHSFSFPPVMLQCAQSSADAHQPPKAEGLQASCLQEQGPQGSKRETLPNMHPHIHVPVNSIKARTTITWPQMPWGRKRHGKFPSLYITQQLHTYSQSATWGSAPLHPEAHDNINGLEKKKVKV
jgi:hypothetical protein